MRAMSVQRRDAGGARQAVDGRHVADDLAGSHIAEDHLAAARVAHRDPRRAAFDEEHVGRQIVKIDHQSARFIGRAADALQETRRRVRVKTLQERTQRAAPM
jgi:hypothetical protein